MRVDEAVVKHTMLITETQGDAENLIQGIRRKDHKIDWLQRLVDELLVWVTVLEGRRDSPLEIPDSPLTGGRGGNTQQAN